MVLDSFSLGNMQSPHAFGNAQPQTSCKSGATKSTRSKRTTLECHPVPKALISGLL